MKVSNQKIGLILGGSSEFGTALTERIVHDYDTLWVHYHSNSAEIKKLQEKYGEKIQLIQADLLKNQDTDKMIETIRESQMIPTHLVHFPALKVMPGKFHKGYWKGFQKQIDCSLGSFVKIAEAFIPDMMRRKEGRIVVMLTSYTLNIPPKFLSEYVTVKYALLGLVKALAVEYADKGITVNGVSPEMTETKFLDDMPDLIKQLNAEKSPMKRNLIVDEVIPTIAFLLSEEAGRINGQNIGITGGI